MAKTPSGKGWIRVRQEPPPRCPSHGLMIGNGTTASTLYFKCKVCGCTAKQSVGTAYEYFRRSSN